MRPVSDMTAGEKLLLERYLIEQERKELADVLSGLFPEQRAFVEDSSQRVSALCTRRAGKTHGARAALVSTAQKYAGVVCVYVALTRAVAKDLMWYPLQELNRERGLGLRFNATELSAWFPNGSRVIITGIDSEPQIEKLRGGKYKLVIIDEAKSFPSWIEQLIEDVLSPALADLGGRLMVIGTPGDFLTGYFYEVTTNPEKRGYSFHSWGILDNQHFPVWAGKKNWKELAVEWFEAEMERRGLDKDSPTRQREWEAKWVASGQRSMYHVDEGRNLYVPDSDMLGYIESLPKTIGIDLGWHDNTAFVTVGYDIEKSSVYEVEEIQSPKLTVNEMVEILVPLIIRYDPEIIVVDTAGEGKIVLNSLVSEICGRFSVPIVAAKKAEKASYVRIADGDLVAGRSFFLADGKLWKQCSDLQWNEKYMREREGMPCDLHDAWLYAYKESCHWADYASQTTPMEEAEEAGFDTPEEMVMWNAVRDVITPDLVDWY